MSLSVPTTTVLDQDLGEPAPEVAAEIRAESHRRQPTLEMIAFENSAPVGVPRAPGSMLTTKYHPGRRYHGGREHVDVIAAEAVAFEVAAGEEFREHRQRVLEAAAILAERSFDDTRQGRIPRSVVVL